jgi:plasmid stability protein
MATLTVRSLPDEVHRALRVRAAARNRSTEAEVRAILEEAVKPAGRLKLGSLLADIGQEIHLSDEELDALFNKRDQTPPRAATFE